MKRCPKCKIWKDENEFGKDAHTKDGLRCWCKTCKVAATRQYEQTIAGKESRKRYQQSNLGRQKARERSRRFGQTDKYKVIKHRYNQSDKGTDMAQRAYEAAKTSGKLKARKAVNDAVYAGKFPPAKDFECHLKDATCSSKMDYHHFKGYEPEHYFDVVPLCRRHHAMVEDGRLKLID